MWGPGAEQGGILQTSSCKLDLKEPYYRMSQPQAYAMVPDQQPHQLIHAQVSTMLEKFLLIGLLKRTVLYVNSFKYII